MANKTVSFTKSGISKLPNNKPVVYRIQTEGGRTNYVGIAKKGRVQDRLEEHIDAGKIPGAKVQIEEKSSVREAEKTEARVIARTEPKYNEKGK